jgi:PAS domain S-box-containing protein
MNLIAYIDLVSVLACLVAAVFLIRGWKRPGFLPAVPILLLTLLVLKAFYNVALLLEWSGFTAQLDWLEDIAGVFIPFTWAFVFYAVIKNAVEEDLKASREHFRNLVESTGDWIWEVDAAGRYTYASPHVTNILGYTSEEIIGKTPFELMPPAEAERVAAIFERIFQKREPFQDLENINLHKDGHRVVLETNGTPAFDSGGKLTGYRGVDRDITQRRENQRLQKEQQAEMDSVFKASPAGIGLVRDRYLVRGNERFFEITGYPKDELLGADPRRFYLTDKDYLAVGEKYDEARESGFARIETRFIQKDQTIIDVVLYVAPLDRGNVDTGFVIVLQDITEFKAARQEANAEKTRAQIYLDVVNVMILVLDTKGCIKLINKKGCELLECKAEKIVGVDWFRLFVPGSFRDISRNAFQRILNGDEKAVADFESPVLTADGVEKLIAWHNTALRDESGKIIGVIRSGDDITKARAAEEAVRESDERLRVALSAAAMGSWRWEAATNQLTRDASLNALLGEMSVETISGSDQFFSFVHPEDRDGVRQEFERAIREGDTYLARYRVQWTDGSLRWVLDQGKSFYDYNGRLECVTGVMVDITELKQAEQRSRGLEQRNRAWLENSPVCTKIVDLDFNLQYMSHAGIAGLKIEDITEFYGKPYPFDFYPESFRNTMTKNLEKARETGEILEQEAPVVDTEGNELWYHSAIVPVNDDEGRIDYIIIVSTDITDRKRTEQTLKFTQFAVDCASDAAYWMGPDAKLVYANELACQSLGYTRDELLSLTVHEIDPDFPAEAWSAHWDQMRKEHTMRFESHHKTKDGCVFPVEITTNFIEYDGAEYNCAFVRNITDRKVAEQKGEVLMQQVQNRNDELQSIVFTAAHDLRSPLVNIAGFTGELEKGLAQLTEALAGAPLDAKVAERVDFLLKTDLPESLRFMKFGNQQMDMLLGGLMRLSRVGSVPMKLATLDMNEMFKGVVRGFQYQIKTLDINLSIQDDLPVCTGDYSLLAQVFINLLDNAIKYRHPDRAAIIEIGGLVRDDMAEYTITDNGIGIEPEQIEKVFDLFHQLDHEPDSDGEGLGLTIVRRILDRQHGSVRIDSKPGLGTTVFVRLPGA